MSKQLYEEALADVKRVKEVAEDNARRAILEAVTPRIRELIEKELLNESDDDELDESVPAGPGAPPGLGAEPDGEEAVAVVAAAPVDATAAISPPDAEGKVTLDVDALCGAPAVEPVAGEPVAAPQFGAPVPAPEEEFEVSMESVGALSKLNLAGKPKGTFSIQLAAIAESVRSLSIAKPSDKRSTQIAETISRVEDMYDHVQASIGDPAQKASYEAKLEGYFKNLNELQEPTMSKVNKKVQQLDEADVTLKLTGMPDDLDLDSVGVDLVTGEDEEGGEVAPDMGAEGGAEGGLDLGGDDQDAGQQMETLNLSDDTIVEIDENMLRREIARMKALREETEPASWGHGVDGMEHDFGGGKAEEDDALDVDIRDVAKISKPLGESDGQMDEADDDDQDDDDDDLDEADAMDEFRAKPVGRNFRRHGEERTSGSGLDEMGYDMDELQNRRKEDEYGHDVADGHQTATWDQRRHESLQKRAVLEAKLQQRAKARAASLKKEAKSTRDAKKLAGLKKEYGVVATRFNESLARSKKVSKLLAVSAKLQKEAAQNGSSTRQAGSKAEEQLRTKLAETNLFNAKLVYTNKLLQNESLTAKQKTAIVKRLEAAKTIREAKLVYEQLSERLADASQRQIAEGADRSVLGSASAATRPAATTTINEGVEAARWARLAGITK